MEERPNVNEVSEDVDPILILSLSLLPDSRPPRNQRSAYRRELEIQAEEHRQRKEKEAEEIREEKFGYQGSIFADDQPRHQGGGRGRKGNDGYSPSILDHGRRRGGNSTYSACSADSTVANGTGLV